MSVSSSLPLPLPLLPLLLPLLLLLLLLICSGGAEKSSVHWMAPFFSGGGYCSEATAFVLALDEEWRVSISQHGDSFSASYTDKLEPSVSERLLRMSRRRVSPPQAVVVCHSEPGAWNLPRPNYMTSLCPPAAGALATVGRTMFETDRLPEGWERRLNQMDEIWVPSSFHADVFKRAGVDADKVHVVPEPVDTAFFSPDRVDPLPLPVDDASSRFVFLSIFKWEERKGWRFLVEAFLREFDADSDAVTLLILTNAYHSDEDFQRKITEFAESLQLPASKQATMRLIHVLPTGLASTEMPRLYKAADAFVLPSRGEGWGRPHVEAMSMALPVIATFWSGPEQYMTEANSYPLRIDGMDEILKGAFKGHKWARPSVEHLQELMRRVFTSPHEGVERGAQARRDMLKNYCMSCVADVASKRLRNLATRVPSKDEL